ncbi:MAG: HlyD family secretion protein, partial [Candidatus Omnitrophota bacterium]
FDETDIGKVKVGQEAVITLDAYPDVRIEGVVDHVAYESEIVNNVTIYDVDIIPESVPEIMRSGMSVTVEAVEKKSAGVLTIPSGAVNYDGKRQFVLVKDKSAQTVERDITVGLNDEKNAEVISGLTIDDKIVLRDAAYMPKKKNTGTNPFMPSRKR